MRPLLFALLLSATAHADSGTTTARTVTRLGEGLYEIRHPDAPDLFPQGNTTVIIGDKAVLVVDSCLLPSAAREDIEQIRKWTQKPVHWLVNTHWHFDHTLGNATYAAAFPGLQIVAQNQTRKEIANYNPGAVARYPGRQQRIEHLLETGKDQDGRTLTEPERVELKKVIAGLAPVVAELKGVNQLVPNVAFDRELTIDLGNREVQVRHLGRGNTAGDTVVWLPRERLLAAGDLLDHPVPYFFGGFPVDLVQTLKEVAALEAKTIVPGHGDVLQGNAYVAQIIGLVSTVTAEVTREMNAGMQRDQILEKVPKTLDVAALRRQFTGEDKDNGEQFDESFAGLVKTVTNQVLLR